MTHDAASGEFRSFPCRHLRSFLIGLIINSTGNFVAKIFLHGQFTRIGRMLVASSFIDTLADQEPRTVFRCEWKTKSLSTKSWYETKRNLS